MWLDCQHLAAKYQGREASARRPDQHACLWPGSRLNSLGGSRWSRGKGQSKAGSERCERPHRGPNLTCAHRPSTWPTGADMSRQLDCAKVMRTVLHGKTMKNLLPNSAFFSRIYGLLDLRPSFARDFLSERDHILWQGLTEANRSSVAVYHHATSFFCDLQQRPNLTQLVTIHIYIYIDIYILYIIYYKYYNILQYIYIYIYSSVIWIHLDPFGRLTTAYQRFSPEDSFPSQISRSKQCRPVSC